MITKILIKAFCSIKNKNCILLSFGSFLVNPLKNTVVKQHFYNVEESYHYTILQFTAGSVVLESHLCSAVGLLLPVNRKEPFNSHSFPGDSRHVPEKAEMTSSMTLSGNSPAGLDLFLAMLFFSPNATFNKCAAVFKTPLTTIKGEIWRIRP